ncbi:transcriptional regulator [Haloferax sp. Atlit-12N]|nr:transcriptional regulator [Haloferax sp. Atlit-12N]
MPEKHPEITDPNEFEGDTEIDPELEFRSKFVEALAYNGFPDTLVLGRNRAGDVFHERRIKIIDYLKIHRPQSVRQLAAELEIDKGVVSRDLQKLAQLDVVEFETDGQNKAPRLKHKHVVVEPVI